MAEPIPNGLADFLTPEAPAPSPPSVDTAPPPGLNEFIQPVLQEEKYGTSRQLAITTAEGAAKGLLGPIATGLEIAGGVKPADIRAREEINPKAHGIAEVGTFLGSAIAGTGEAALLGEAGKALETGTGLSRATRISQMGTEATRAAFEGALYQGGEELHKRFIQDPNQSAESAITNIGISSILGGMFGGTIGAALKPEASTFVSELDRPAFDAGDLKTHIATGDIKPEQKNQLLEAFKLNKEKAEAPAIRNAAKELGAPVLDGMTLESPLIQRHLDALINSPYTFSGHAIGTKFDEAYQAAEGALQGAISAGETGSKAAVGDAVKEGLTQSIREQYAPIKAGYDELYNRSGPILIKEDVVTTLSKELRDIPEFRVSPSSPQGALVKQIFNDLKNVKTVDDLKILRDGLSLPATASSQERRMVGILKDKLGSVEESTLGTADKELKKNLAPAYKELINKVNTLSEKLGKGRIYGVEDALHFINERLTPEEVASKLFTKKDSEFTKFFQKNFPGEFSQVRNYQRQEMIDRATKGDTGFSSKTFFNNFNKLEPETQKSLYLPQETKKISAAETYLRDSFPKNFNPSGTAHTLAHRLAHETPRSMILANARDYGMAKAIELASKSAEGKQAVSLAESTIKGENLANNVIRGLFNASKDVPKSIIPNISSRVKLDKFVESYIKDPSKLVAMNDNNNSVPEYSVAFAASAARVVQYLGSLKPNTNPKLPLDSRRPANQVQKSAYERALDIAEQPLVVLKALKEGRITSKDIMSLKIMYPNLYNNLAQKMSEAVVDTTYKKQSISYSTRMGLSLFLGQPLDSTMTPQAIMSAQMKATTPPTRSDQQQPQSSSPSSTAMKGLQKLPSMSQTPGQQREMSRSTGRH